MTTPDMRRSPKMRAVDKQIKELEQALETAKRERGYLLQKQHLQCPTCRRKTPLSQLFLIPGERFHRSYSSYEDSSWDRDGKHYTVCPHCTELLELTDKAFIEEFKGCFMEPKYGYQRARLVKREQVVSYDCNYDRKDRRDKLTVLVDRDHWHGGYDEILLTYEQVANAVDGKLTGR